MQKQGGQVENSGENASKGSAENQPAQSSELYEQANRLFLDGRIEEALKILRELAEKNPQAYLPDVAQILHNLGVLNSNHNRLQEAKQQYEEALKIRRELAEKNPQAYLPKVAESLISLGVLSTALHRAKGVNTGTRYKDKADGEYEEALKIYRELAQKDPQTYLIYTAHTLINLGVLNSNESRLQEARQQYEELLKIRRELAEKNPTTYLPDLAQTLHNLGVLDSGWNRLREARQEYEEALKIRRELAEKDPKAFLPDLAHTLHNLGLLNSNQNRLQEAKQQYEEALKIRRELAEKNPQVYLPDLAHTLHNLGLLNSNQNRLQEAKQQYEEALKIRRELAEKNPQVYLPDLAHTLRNLGLLDSTQQLTKEAQQKLREALKIYRELAQKDPQAYLTYAAMTYSDLGLPILAATTTFLSWQGMWPIVAVLAGVATALLVLNRIFSWRFRFLVNRLMRKSEGRFGASAAQSATAQATTAGYPLLFRYLEVKDIQPATGQEITAISEAASTTRHTRMAYIFATIAYTVVTTSAVSISFASRQRLHFDLLVTLIYMMQWMPLLFLVLFLGMYPRRQRQVCQ